MFKLWGKRGEAVPANVPNEEYSLSSESGQWWALYYGGMNTLVMPEEDRLLVRNCCGRTSADHLRRLLSRDRVQRRRQA